MFTVYVNIARESSMMICVAVIGNVGGERTICDSGNAFFSKYVGCGVFGIRICYLKLTAADIKRSCKAVYVAVVAHKLTAGDRCGSPASDQVVICTRYFELATVYGELAGNTDAVHTFNYEGSAFNSEIALDDQTIVTGNGRDPECVAVEVPYLCAFNSKLFYKVNVLEKHNGISGVLCRFHSFSKSSVLEAVNLCFRAGLDGDNNTIFSDTSAFGTLGITRVSLFIQSCFLSIDLMGVRVFAVDVNVAGLDGMVSFSAVIGNVGGERTTCDSGNAFFSKYVGCGVFGIRICYLKLTAADIKRSCKAVYVAVVAHKLTADDRCGSPASDQVVICIRYFELATVYGELAGNADTVTTADHELTALDRKVALDYDAVISVNRIGRYSVSIEIPLLFGCNSKLFGESYVCVKYDSFAVLCSRNCFSERSVLNLANLCDNGREVGINISAVALFVEIIFVNMFSICRNRAASTFVPVVCFVGYPIFTVAVSFVSINSIAVRIQSMVTVYAVVCYVGGEITARNGNCAEYVGAVFLIGNIKRTALDLGSTTKTVYVTVNRLESTALDSGSSPVTDQIVIRRSGEVTVFNGKRTISSNADAVNIIEFKASARDSKFSANYHCVCFFIDILYVKRYTAEIPFHIAFNNDLLENHDNVTGICRRNGVLESSVVYVSNISES